MWHQYLQNLFNRRALLLKFFQTALFLLLSAFSFKSYAEAEKKPPGMIESLRFSISETRESLKKLFASSEEIERFPEGSNLHPDFVKSILLHSEKSFLHFINQDFCQFVSLVDNNLLKDSTGTIKKILFVDRNGKLKSVRKTLFVKSIIKDRCSLIKPIRDLYSKQTILKTIRGLNLAPPKSETQCRNILELWKNNSSMPYLCSVPEVIEKGPKVKIYLEKANVPLSQQEELRDIVDKYQALSPLTFFEKNLITNLCNGLSQSSLYCAPYLKDDVWSKTLSGEKPASFLSYSCQQLLGKQLTPLRLKSCAYLLKQEPKKCYVETTPSFSSLSPKENCDKTSLALNNSRLRVDYEDCPSSISNTSMTNIYRILQHFDYKKPKNSETESCSSTISERFFEINKDFKNEQAWPLKICYDDPISKKEACLPYIPGTSNHPTMSEELVVSKIVKKVGKLSTFPKCRLLQEKEYNPVFLEYKNGCFILYKKSQCSFDHCPKKIILDQKEIKAPIYKGSITFDYFANSYTTQKFSMANILDEVKNIKSFRLLNYTQIKNFLTVNPNGIIHGLGCSEDLLPQFFQRAHFSECRPMPFIVDGFKEIDDQYYLVIRTAIDDLHSPRMLKWDWTFSAVSNYKNFHPFKDWVLYGLKK